MFLKDMLVPSDRFISRIFHAPLPILIFLFPAFLFQAFDVIASHRGVQAIQRTIHLVMERINETTSAKS